MIIHHLDTNMAYVYPDDFFHPDNFYVDGARLVCEASGATITFFKPESADIAHMCIIKAHIEDKHTILIREFREPTYMVL